MKQKTFTKIGLGIIALLLILFPLSSFFMASLDKTEKQITFIIILIALAIFCFGFFLYSLIVLSKNK